MPALGNNAYYTAINPNLPFSIGKRVTVGNQSTNYHWNILQNDNLIPHSGVRVNPDVYWNYPAMTFSDTIFASGGLVYSRESYFQNYKGNIVNFEVDNNSGEPITNFQVQLKDTPAGEWYTYISGGDFNAISGNMLYSSNPTPANLSNGQKGHGKIKIDSAFGVRFGAVLSSGVGNVVIQASFE